MNPNPNPNHRAPSSKPPFTLSDLRSAVPPRCFRRSLLRSSAHLLADLSAASLLLLAAAHLHRLPRPLLLLAWPLYVALQGCAFTALLVLGHECGHHAFSDHRRLDDAVGLLLHSSLLVPYFSWKLSHRRHHSHANNLALDEVFVPQHKNNLKWYHKYYLKTPPGQALRILVTLAAGWPLYLSVNASGRDYHQSNRFISHYNPYSPMFSDKERTQIIVSNISVILVIYGLFRCLSLNDVVLVYLLPLGVMHGFLVLITVLQHTHASVPHYDSSEWDWLRGALATVDRDYGFLLNRVFHHATDTHLVHHLFPSLPHYHAVETTGAVRAVLGEYYRFDRTPVLRALWREARECVYVEEGERGVFWYNNEM